jgi:hypothetical protein
MTLAPGHYRARAVEGDFGVAGTGTKQIAVLFEITEGEARGERVTWYGYFTPATAERTIESLRHCGCTFPDDAIDDLDGLTVNEVGLVLEEEHDEHGPVRLRVRWVNRLASGVALGARLDAAAKRSFADEMRGFVMASRAKNGAAAPTPPPAPAPTASRPQPRAATPMQTQPRAAVAPPKRGSMNGARPGREPGDDGDEIPY